MKPKYKWVSHIKNKEEQAEFAKQVLVDLNRESYNRLRTILIEKYDIKQTVRIDDYDTPSWSHKQAHTNGYLECLEEILGLLTPNNEG